MMKRYPLLLLFGCALSVQAPAAAYYDWSVFTQQFTYLAADLSACNQAPGSTACSGYVDIGTATLIDRSLSGAPSYTTSGRADLASGEIGIAASGEYPYDTSIVNAGYTDNVTLSIPGLGPASSASVGIRLIIDGGFADGSYVGGLFTAVPGSAFANRVAIDPYWSGTFDGGPSTPVSSDLFTLASAPAFSSVGTGAWRVTDQRVFETSIEVHGDDPVLSFRYVLYGAGALDLTGTGTLELILPAGSSAVSDSGTFGSVAGITVVPLPGALPLLLGALVAGLCGSRRR